MAVIDKSGGDVEELELGDEGGDNGVTLEKDSDINNAIDEQAGESDSKPGAKDSKDEKGTGEDGSELQEEEGSGDEKLDPVAELQAKIQELEQKLQQGQVKPPEQPPVQAPTPKYTEEEWAQHEERWGVPRAAIQNTVDAIVKSTLDMRAYIDSKFAKYEKQEALNEIATDPEYADALKYQKEVNQYLERVDPKYHSEKSVLKDAVIYARGLNYKNGIQKVRNEREVNKRIAGSARPAGSGGSKGNVSTKTVTLTELQKSAAAATGMSEKEYASLLGKGRIIAK